MLSVARPLHAAGYHAPGQGWVIFELPLMTLYAYTYAAKLIVVFMRAECEHKTIHAFIRA